MKFQEHFKRVIRNIIPKSCSKDVVPNKAIRLHLGIYQAEQSSCIDSMPNEMFTL